MSSGPAPITIGVIGLGPAGLALLSHVDAHPAYRLAAVCDTRPAALEASRAACRLPLATVIVAGMLQHVPAVFMQGQLIAQVAAAIEHAEAFRAEQPFVPIGHGEGAVAGLDVEGLGAELLDGVHAQQNALAAAACAQAQQVQAQAAGVLHRADRQQPRARPAGGEQGGFRIIATQVDLHHLDTARR